MQEWSSRLSVSDPKHGSADSIPARAREFAGFPVSVSPVQNIPSIMPRPFGDHQKLEEKTSQCMNYFFNKQIFLLTLDS